MRRATATYLLLFVLVLITVGGGNSLIMMRMTMRTAGVVAMKQQQHQLRSSSAVVFQRDFLGQQQSIHYFHQQPRTRSYTKRTRMTMMPEGPEVRTLVDQLQGAVGKRLVDIRFLSGRYVRNGRPETFQAFAKTMSPVFQPHSSKPQPTDIIQSWNAKGKFMYILLDQRNNNRNNPNNNNEEEETTEDDDFQRSIWITLGMTGQFVSEHVHHQDPRYARWYLDTLDIATNTHRKVYYHDQRNFGTLKFSLSKEELSRKLESLGPDILDTETTENDFLEVISRQRVGSNVCAFLMDQSKIAGVGNYILAEGLYRASIDPFSPLEELDEDQKIKLFQELRSIAQESYLAQGLTRPDGGTFRNVQGERGKFEFELQCYGRQKCAKGNLVIRETGPHKRSIWYTEQQLFIPRSERGGPFTPKSTKIEMSSNISEKRNELDAGNMGGNVDAVESLISGLSDPSWKSALSETFASEWFHNLASFIQEERGSGKTIYPPQEEIFSALNLCPLDTVKVVIVGQDPYHGPGQGHGLAFSVRRGVKPPPSLKNIVREAMNDVNIQEPKHGNLEHWAKQGVLLINTVLTVRQGQANSHAKRGWEEFTDAVIQEVNASSSRGVVFLLWGNAAAKKTQGVDMTKHVLITTSHPSPLGATKTKSPFLGSRCFSRANDALVEMNIPPIDWSIV